MSDRIVRLLTGLGLLVALDVSQVFDWIWHAGLLHKIRSYGTLSQILGLISSFLRKRQLRLYLNGKSFQEHPVNVGVPQGSMVLHISYYTWMTFLMMLPVILLSMLMILLYSKCYQASDLWQQLELPSKLESDLRATMDWERKWLLDFNAGKTRLV